jgi:hypothetical protein
MKSTCLASIRVNASRRAEYSDDDDDDDDYNDVHRKHTAT